MEGRGGRKKREEEEAEGGTHNVIRRPAIDSESRREIECERELVASGKRNLKKFAANGSFQMQGGMKDLQDTFDLWIYSRMGEVG